MKEMKDMIMCIANHLGGVRSENVAQLPLSQNQNQAQQQSQNQSFGQNLSQSQQQWQQQNQQQNANQITNVSTAVDDDDMTDGEQTEDDEGDASRKKLKQTHLQVFDTQSSTGKKGANYPSLLQNASDHSIGSDGNHSIDAVDLASMYD